MAKVESFKAVLKTIVFGTTHTSDHTKSAVRRTNKGPAGEMSIFIVRGEGRSGAKITISMTNPTASLSTASLNGLGFWVALGVF
jgi:hypothetical protein